MIAFRSGDDPLGSGPTGATRRDGCSWCSLIASVKFGVWNSGTFFNLQFPRLFLLFFGLKNAGPTVLQVYC